MNTKLVLKNKKAQTTMEYFMTYGWAIIIVIIVAIALFRLGVFTPDIDKNSENFDEFQVGTDFNITSDGTARVVLINKDNQSRTVTMNAVTVDGQACTGDTGALGFNNSWTVACTGLTAGASGTPYTGISVTANYSISGIPYVEIGKISGRYE